MSLEDKDLFNAIVARHPGQDIELIMAEYEKAKMLLSNIEKPQGAPQVTGMMIVEEETVAEEQPAPKAKKYTRRDLVVKPAEAIEEDSIACCLCGARRQTLTQRHLSTHGISVADYKKLCNYAPETPLMSKRHLEKSKRIIARAQQARMNKKMKESDL